MVLAIDAKAAAEAASTSQTRERWAATKRRDRSVDGTFVCAVKTTGIYCRPSCPARLPRRENVIFYGSCQEAEVAGFRPCKRCKPAEAPTPDRASKIVAEACQTIAGAEEPPTIDDLAAAAGLSTQQFHRVFKATTGITPKAYAAAERRKRVGETLRRSRTVTEAIYGSGFNSSGRFYETAQEMLGMTPSQYRAGGKDVELRFSIGACSLGSVLVAASDKGIVAIFLGDDPEALVRELEKRFPESKLVGGKRDFERVVAKVIKLVEAPGKGLELPLDIRGTAFQQRVWQALRDIPPGSTMTYTDIAKRIGKPNAVRAVAGACAANRIAIAIPCHRVIHRGDKKGGALAGYRWGVERKRALIDREKK